MSGQCKCCQDNYVVDNLYVKGNLYVRGTLQVEGEAIFNSNVTIRGKLNQEPSLGGSQHCINQITVSGVYNINLFCNGVEINITNPVNPKINLYEDGQPISTNMLYTLLNQGSFTITIRFRGNDYSVQPNQGLVIFLSSGEVRIITF